MKIIYEVKNLGRSKWRGEVVAQSAAVEHIEAALERIALKHLMSREIDFDGDDHEGKIIVGGFRVVGEYKRKAMGKSPTPTVGAGDVRKRPLT